MRADCRGLVRWIVAAPLVLCGLTASLAHADDPMARIDRSRQLFPQAHRWFLIVAGQRFTSTPDGALLPRHETLTHSRVRWQDGAGQTVLPRFPARFRDWMRVTSSASSDSWVEIAPIGGEDVSARVHDGLVVYPEAFADTDIVFKSTPTHTDEYLVLWSADAPTRWRYRVQLGPAIRRLRQTGQAIEAVDHNEIPWLRTTRPVAFDVRGHRAEGTIRLEGDELVLELPVAGLVHPILVDPDWRSTGDMAEGRFHHRSVVLPDGRMLVTGGCSASVCSGDLGLPDCRNIVRSAEALDVDTRTFARVTEDIAGRYFHVAEALADGRVLVVGGCATNDCRAANATAAILDPVSGRFREIVAPPDVGAAMIAAALPDGRILVAGGCIGTECTSSSAAFDADTETWTVLAPMRIARGRAPVATLAGGAIFVAGGCTSMACTTVLADAEVYDPTRDVWESARPMTTPRAGHFATTLADGRVLVGGGCADQACSRVLRSTEVFDSTTMGFAPFADLVSPRFGVEALLLPDASVMVSQGCSAARMCDLTNELLDPMSETFSPMEPARTARAFHTLLVHEASQTVIANGGCQPSTCSWWTETYDISERGPTRPPPSPAARDAGADSGASAQDASRADASTSRGTGPVVDAGPAVYVPPSCVCRIAGPAQSAPRAWLGGWSGVLLLFVTATRLVRRRRSGARLATTVSGVQMGALAEGSNAVADRQSTS